MRRAALLVSLLLIPLSIHAQVRRRVASSPPSPVPETVPQAAGAPLPDLTAAQLAAFNAGLNAFNRDASVASGLGPVFNEDSCRQCHSAPASGGGGNRTVTRFARLANGSFDAMASLGGSLVQDHAIGGRNGASHNFVAESVPAGATIVARRRTTPLFGLGLVDATPDATFVALAAAEATRGSGTAGRVNMADNLRAGTKTVGRFGWKAQVPTLFQFAGDALVNEMGITTPDFPSENCPQGNCAELAFNPAPGLNDSGSLPAALDDFMRMLAAPTRGPQTADTATGAQLFESIGCTACHTAALTSGSSTIAALDHKTYHPYSDFLLHDMGALGDGIEMAGATGSEVRTEPLWGLRFVGRFLHDGRATTLEQAIAAHDGQGRDARSAFAALPADAQGKVLAFLRSL